MEWGENSVMKIQVEVPCSIKIAAPAAGDQAV